MAKNPLSKELDSWGFFFYVKTGSVAILDRKVFAFFVFLYTTQPNFE